MATRKKKGKPTSSRTAVKRVPVGGTKSSAARAKASAARTKAPVARTKSPAGRRKAPAAMKAKPAATQRRQSPPRKARPLTAASSGSISSVTETLATALGGVTEATLDMSSTALTAIGNSVRAAQQIGGEAVKATAAAAAESLEAAQRAWRGGVKPPEKSPRSAPRK